MQSNRENFKAQAQDLLTDPQARLTDKERHELFSIGFTKLNHTAADVMAVNRIAERIKGVEVAS